MNSFQWEKSFNTGLPDVDSQHRRLVDLINRFVDLVSEGTITGESLDGIYAELVDYTEYHFRDEESLTASIGLDPRHRDFHAAQHRQFVDEVLVLKDVLRPDNEDSLKQLLDFLIHWLVYHILGADQNMARQIAAIRSGVSPQQAYEAEQETRDVSKESLLTALNNLFSLLSVRNKELVNLNKTLEKKVSERTEALSQLNSHLEELSLTDALTGLHNRRSALNILERHWERSLENEGTLTCLMVDADFFKEVNDRYGHDAGDQVLRGLSRILQNEFRGAGVVCRLGGDEFLVICPDTELQHAIEVADRVRLNISGVKISAGAGYWTGSVSIGAAGLKPEMTGFQDLIKAADLGVYEAKRDGKNCVRTAQKFR